MRFGCCLNMNAKGADGTGIEAIEAIARMGFDYAELPLAEMTALSSDAFDRLAARVEKSGIRCEACNNFFPRTMRLTGDSVDQEAVMAYAEKALGRAGKLGVQYVIFGSGGAKNVPAGFPLEEGIRQIVQLLRDMAPIARKNAITICIEPLRKAECNIVNSFREGCALAKEAAAPEVRVLADYYHVQQEHESVSHIREDGREYLRHVHFAREAGRTFPTDIHEDAYMPFIDALKACGYDERVSCEAYTEDFTADAPKTLQFFRENF